jgi:hypothetical protein
MTDKRDLKKEILDLLNNFACTSISSIFSRLAAYLLNQVKKETICLKEGNPADLFNAIAAELALKYKEEPAKSIYREDELLRRFYYQS